MSRPLPLPPRAFQGRQITRGTPGRSVVCSAKMLGVSANEKERDNYFNKKVAAAAERGVKKAVKYLLEQTLTVTPQATGVLKKSGKTVFIGKGMNTKGIVWFDEMVAPYAIFVHEDLSKYHKPPTIAKFLQRTQFRLRGELSKIIRDEIAKARP